MAGSFLNKIFGGEKKSELDSCCGSVTVTPEEEATPSLETQGAEAAAAETFRSNH